MLAAFLTSLCFALSGVFAHRSVVHLGPDRANLARLAVAIALLGAFAHVAGSGLAGPTVPWFILSGVIGFGLGDWALFQALPRLGSRLTLLMTQCLAAPIAIVAEAAWMGTVPDGRQLGFVLLILVGVALALAPGRGPAPVHGRALLVGLLWGLGSAFGQGGGAVVSRYAYQVAEVAGTQPDALTATYQRLIGGIAVTVLLLLVARRHVLLGIPQALLGPAARAAAADAPPGTASHAIAGEGQAPAATGGRLRASGWVVANALAGPVFGVSCFQWALATTPSGIVLPIVALTPLVAIPLAFLLEGDRPTRRSLLGGLVAVAGAAGLAAS